MPRTRPAVLPLNQQRKRNPRTHHAHPTRPAKETGHVIRPLLQQAIRARHRNLAIPLTPTHPARARTALPPRQPATLHLRTDRISRGALPHRARMLHHVPNARKPGHLLRRPPSQATTQPIRIHPRHPNRRHHRRHATGHERRVLPTARLLHETRLPLEIRHGVAGHVPHLAAHRNHPADRHLGHLSMRLPPIRRRRPHHQHPRRHTRLRHGKHCHPLPTPTAHRRRRHHHRARLRAPLRGARDRPVPCRNGVAVRHGAYLSGWRAVRCEPREQRQCGRLRRGHHRHVRPVRRDHSVEARRPHVGRRFHAHDGGDQGAFRHAQDRVLYVTRVGVVLRGLRIVDGPWLLRAALRHRAYRVLAR